MKVMCCFCILNKSGKNGPKCTLSYKVCCQCGRREEEVRHKVPAQMKCPAYTKEQEKKGRSSTRVPNAQEQKAYADAWLAEQVRNLPGEIEFDGKGGFIMTLSRNAPPGVTFTRVPESTPSPDNAPALKDDPVIGMVKKLLATFPRVFDRDVRYAPHYRTKHATVYSKLPFRLDVTYKTKKVIHPTHDEHSWRNFTVKVEVATQDKKLQDYLRLRLGTSYTLTVQKNRPHGFVRDLSRLTAGLRDAVNLVEQYYRLKAIREEAGKRSEDAVRYMDSVSADEIVIDSLLTAEAAMLVRDSGLLSPTVRVYGL